MTQPPSEGVTKKQIAQMLAGEGKEPLSISTVEKLIAAAGIEPVYTPERIGRGKVVLYSPADAERLVSERQKAKESGESQALTARPHQGPGALAELLTTQRQGFESLRAVQDPWPIWMTRQQAVELSGVPASYFDKGVHAGELPHTGAGTGRRYHRDDVRRFAERMRAPGFIEGLKK